MLLDPYIRNKRFMTGKRFLLEEDQDKKNLLFLKVHLHTVIFARNFSAFCLIFSITPSSSHHHHHHPHPHHHHPCLVYKSICIQKTARHFFLFSQRHKRSVSFSRTFSRLGSFKEKFSWEKVGSLLDDDCPLCFPFFLLERERVSYLWGPQFTTQIQSLIMLKGKSFPLNNSSFNHSLSGSAFTITP